MRQDQYLLDFTSRANDRCARIIALREAPLPVAMTQGRVEGVIELVQRLTILCRDLPESIGEPFSVDAQVVAIAARIERRRTVSEKTIRNWTADAKLLGIIEVSYASQQYGGSRWNRYTINFARALELITAPRSWTQASSDAPAPPSMPGGNGRKRPVTTSAPGAETVSAPNTVLRRVSSNHSPLTSSEIAVVASDDLESFESVQTTDWPKALIGLGMSEDGARGAVARALARGLTHAQIGELVELYREASARDAHMTAGWLYRWLTGQSSPPKPSAAAPKPPQSTCGGRGDGLSRAQVDSERLRFQIIRQARAAGLGEDAIRERCSEMGVVY